MQRKAFFKYWTRKEAYIKAKGKGLSLPLNQFDVSHVPEKPVVLLNTKGGLQEFTCWYLHDITPYPDYVASIAVKGKGWLLSYWQWQV